MAKKTPKLHEYRVTWEIDVDAKNHKEAAKEAQAMMQDDPGIGWSFTVRQWGKRNAIARKVDLKDEQ